MRTAKNLKHNQSIKLNIMEKVQSRKVGVAGGFINQMAGNNKTEPKVGEGATILWYSDRTAYEVTSVSDCGNKCQIRKMTTKFVGSGYGDEQYEYISDETQYTRDLEWNPKKQKWGEVTYSVEVIKALQKRLWAKYGWDWADHLPQGLTWAGLRISDSRENWNKLKLIKGVTKEYKNFNPISISFGWMDEYRDPSF